MASLILKMSVSLDGYVARPTVALTGRPRDDLGRREWVLDTMSNADVHLMGAGTYVRWADFWPNASGPFAEPMNEIPKVVFSDSPRPPSGRKPRSRPETWLKPSSV